MAKRKIQRRTNNSSNQSQHLVHAWSQVSSSSGNTPLVASVSGVIQTRPARPKALTLTYYSSVPRSFIFTIYGANTEEVYRSPTMLSGPIPQTRRFNFPTSTDYSLYSGSEQIIRFDHATNPDINWVGNMKVQYKSPSPNVYF